MSTESGFISKTLTITFVKFVGGINRNVDININYMGSDNSTELNLFM